MVFVRNDSKEFRFCRSKCHRAFKKKRNPRKVGWTKTFRKAHNKELTNDLTFQMEMHRNTLPKYNREIMQRSVEAMRKVTETRAKRQNHFIMGRLKKGSKLRKLEDIKLVKTDLHFIQAPHATRKIYEPKNSEEEEEVDEEEVDLDMVEEQDVAMADDSLDESESIKTATTKATKRSKTAKKKSKIALTLKTSSVKARTMALE